VNAQQENRPKIFDRIPARVLPNSQVPEFNLEKNQIPLDNSLSHLDSSDDGGTKSPTVTTSSMSGIPVEERLSYVMTSLNTSIQNSTLPEVNSIML